MLDGKAAPIPRNHVYYAGGNAPPATRRIIAALHQSDGTRHNANHHSHHSAPSMPAIPPFSVRQHTVLQVE